MEELIVDRKSNRSKNNKKRKNKKVKLIIACLVGMVIALVSIIVLININSSEVKVVTKNKTSTSTKEDDYIGSEGISSSNSYGVQDNSTSNIDVLKKNILIVNKEHSVDKDYMPYDLVIPNIKADKEVKVRKEVAEKLEELFSKAKNEGINLVAVSGYRTFDYQEYLYNNSVQTSGKEHATQYVAEAGYSEHQTGLALDLACKEYMNLDEGFENTDAFKWLQNNMSDYGFILRYLKGKEEITGYNYEPWHIRYVGVDLAKDITSKGVTLEEYVGLKG